MIPRNKYKNTKNREQKNFYIINLIKIYKKKIK